MKYLGFLVLSVVFLAATWLLLGKPLGFVEPASKASLPQNPSLGPAGRDPAALEFPKNSKDGKALASSAEQLRSAGLYAPRDCAQLVEVLVGTLTPAEWEQASEPILKGWSSLIKGEQGQSSIASIEDKLLGRFLRESNAGIVEELLKCAAGDPKKSQQVAHAIDRLFEENSPTSRLEASRQSLLVFAFMRRGEYQRARAYFSKIRWGNSEPDPMALPTRWLGECLELCDGAERGIYEIPRIIGLWLAVGEGSLRDNAQTGQDVRKTLEAVMLRAVKSPPLQPGMPSRETMMKESVGVPRAAEFWRHLLRLLAKDKSEAIETRMEVISPLLSSFASHFKAPQVEYSFWSEVLVEIPKDHFWPSRRIACLKLALDAAPDDERRAEATLKLVSAYEEVLDFEGCRRVLAESLSKIADPVFKASLANAMEKSQRAEDVSKARWAEQERTIAGERVRSRLELMRDQLARARREKKPSEDIRSLENVVKQLELQTGQ